MAAYYNEFDKGVAEWLRWLIKLGQIAPGEVDERDIMDVRPDDLRGFTQCHFFAGVGGWSLALRLAGWPDDRPVWTGSCPCQPFSAAGKRAGTSDERHLWPAFEWLIRACRPVTVMGEQVASKDGLAWLDIVHADLEGQGYTFGALDLCSAGLGAPHIRQRLWFRGDANIIGRPNGFTERSSEGAIEAPGRAGVRISTDSEHAGHDSAGRPSTFQGSDEKEIGLSQRDGAAIPTDCDTDEQRRSSQSAPQRNGQERRDESMRPRAPIQSGGDTDGGDASAEREFSGGQQRLLKIDRGSVPDGLTSGFWAGCEWQLCRDGKCRPWEGDAERSVFKMADGLPANLVHSGETCYPLIGKGQEGRTMRLRGYGNAINPWNAVEFILATEETV